MAILMQHCVEFANSYGVPLFIEFTDRQEAAFNESLGFEEMTNDKVV